jgi:hypothetical protein
MAGGMMINTTGNDAVRYKSGMFWLSKIVHDEMAIGVRLAYHHYDLNRLISNQYMSGSIGFKTKIADKFYYGFLIEDIYGWINKKDENGLGVIRSGVAFQLADNFYFSIDVIKENIGSPYMNASFFYERLSKFFINVGYDSGHESVNLTMAFKTGKLTATIGIQHHPYLGYTAQTLLSNDLKEFK